MGMFDYIRCERELPGVGLDPSRAFQTKDTPAQLLDDYLIKADGSLCHEDYDYEDRSDPDAKGLLLLLGCGARVHRSWEPVSLTGEIVFYGFKHEEPVSGVSGWLEFSAYFIDGKLQSLVCVKNEG